MWAWHQVLENERTVDPSDGMRSAFLGPSFTTDEIAAWLDERGYPYQRLAKGEQGPEVAAAVASR